MDKSQERGLVMNEATDHNYHAFISYSRNEAVCHLGEEFFDFLQRELGYKTFLDHKDIFPNAKWEQVIVDALSSAKVLILIATKEACENRDYIDKELKLARERDIPILAVEYATGAVATLLGAEFKKIQYIKSISDEGKPHLTPEVTREIRRGLQEEGPFLAQKYPKGRGQPVDRSVDPRCLLLGRADRFSFQHRCTTSPIEILNRSPCPRGKRQIRSRGQCD